MSYKVPLDQVDRDWNLGNCYYVTLEFIKDSEAMVAEGLVPSETTILVVHGILDSQGKRVRHAWIEVGNRVIDNSNDQGIVSDRAVYYDANAVEVGRKFSRKEVDALLSYLEAPSQQLPIGYWGDLSDEQVTEALSSYDAGLSVLNSDIIFSDPTMSTFDVVITGGPNEVKRIRLPEIPRVGDELDFGEDGKYAVGRVVWCPVSEKLPQGMVALALTKLDPAGRPVKG